VLAVEVQPYAIAKTFKRSHLSDFSSIFIDIGGGTTDIAITQNGGIIGTRMIAFGGRVFTKRIAKDMNLEMHEAEKMKIQYSEEKLQIQTKNKIKRSLFGDSQLWAEGVEISLSEFSELTSYPTEILICGGGSELPEIHDSLISYPWLAVLPFEKFPKINHIYPKQISHVQDITGLANSTSDVVPVALVSISIDHISKIQDV
jgi:cell division protein FtsA